jgi:AraC-like DNA-binding protein
MEHMRTKLEFPKDFPLRIYNSKLKYDHTFLHAHDCLELCYGLEGKGITYINDTKFDTRPGDIFVLNNLDFHFSYSISGMEQARMLVIMFDPAFICPDPLSPLSQLYLSPFYINNLKINENLHKNADKSHRHELCTLFNEIYREVKSKNTGYQGIIQSNILKILSLITRYYLPQGNTNMNQMILGTGRVQKVIQYIREHYREPITVPQLARHINMSDSAFSHLFKSITACSPIEYLIRFRVSEAVKLLQNTDKKIIDVASATGFNNYTNFTTLFKKHVGCTPSQLRREKQNTFKFSIITEDISL